MVNDPDWFPLFQRGEEAAFRNVFDKYYRPVHYFALKILNDDIYAEDIVSETFRKAWDARMKFATPRHLENFLYLVTRNGCISYLRTMRVHHKVDKEWVKLVDEDVHGENPTDSERVQALLLEKVYGKLNALGDRGIVLRMSFIEGKTTEEISQELNISENNVYILKSRGLKALRALLTGAEWMFFVYAFMRW
jgi:RNA polymerase sigma-70 factor (ECF subfamily)